MNKTTVVMVVAILLVTAIAITIMFSLLISHKPEPAELVEKKRNGENRSRRENKTPRTKLYE